MESKATPVTGTITTASATAAALFALQHQADAAIIYSGSNQNLTTTPAVTFSHTGSGAKSFFIGGNQARMTFAWNRKNSTTSSNQQRFKLAGGGLFANGSGALKKLASGALISAGKINHAGSALLRSYTVHRNSSREGVIGTWGSGGAGFGGFRLTNGDLGWVRLKYDFNSGTMTAVDWAYNNVAGQSINAGQTAGGIPEPSTAALLALAGAGAACLRRRRAGFKF